MPGIRPAGAWGLVPRVGWRLTMTGLRAAVVERALSP